MKRKILTTLSLVVLIVICFFYYLNKRIEGIWIKHYSTDLSNHEFFYDGNILLDIKNQKFSTYYSGLNGIPEETNYFNFGTNLKLWPLETEYNFSYSIKSINNDSLILTKYNFEKIIEVVYKKIPDTLKNNSDWQKKLLWNAYEFRLPEYTDTIYFDNRFIMSKNQTTQAREWDSQDWKLTKINGFDIMFTGNWATFILVEKDDKISFYAFDNKKRLSKAELKKIDIDLSKVKKIAERIKQKYPNKNVW
ncbi:MAG: hypothetical protein GXO79_10930 [Chlorobi bacterium]|nr:hypothetical protein [Chlorobiota bacterium]